MERPRCPAHGLVVSDARGCIRCFQREPEPSSRLPLLAGGLLGSILIAMLVLRVYVGLTDRPTRTVSAEPAVTAVGTVPAVTTAQPGATDDPIAAEMARVPVRVYTAAYCGWCTKAKKDLSEKGIAYTELRIDEDRAAKAEMHRIGGRGIPTFDIEGDVHSGYSPSWVDGTIREHARRRVASTR